jgi:guanylate kinase
LAKAEAEMERSPGFDVELINDVLETATKELILRTAVFLGPTESK